MAATANQFGRKPGRGLRPWMLLPKIIAVAMLIGGLAAVVATAGPPHALASSAATTRAVWAQQVDSLEHLFRWVVIPGSTAAIIFGVALFFQHPAVFIRQRWMQVKLLLVLLGLPMLHLLMRSRTLELAAWVQSAGGSSEAEDRGLALLAEIRWLAAGGLLLCVLIAVIGRHKPRLGRKAVTRQPARKQTDSKPASEA